MGIGFGMLLAFAIVVLGGLAMAGLVVLLRNRDSAKSAKTESESVEPKR